MEYRGKYKSGKLFAKRFVRIKTTNDRHPFARRIVKSNQSYAFAVASDVSSSMFNGGANTIERPGCYATSSLYMVGEALRYASIPRALIIFGDKPVVIAPMGKLQIRWEQIINKDSIRKADDGGTNIAKAINACTKELRNIKAERKIIIVLTDGSSCLEDMKEAHKKAIEEGIECLGITIGNRNNSYMEETFSEKKNTQIKDTKDTKLIGKAFIDILKKSITKSI
jgi:nitric oxide reductase activation protein